MIECQFFKLTVVQVGVKSATVPPQHFEDLRFEVDLSIEVWPVSAMTYTYGDRAQAAVDEVMIREAVAEVLQKTSDGSLSQEEADQAWENLGFLLDLNPAIQDEPFG